MCHLYLTENTPKHFWQNCQFSNSLKKNAKLSDHQLCAPLTLSTLSRGFWLHMTSIIMLCPHILIFVYCNFKVAYCGRLCKVNCLLGAISDKEQDINDRNTFTKRENKTKLEIFLCVVFFSVF